MKILVKCTLFVPVEVPDEDPNDEYPYDSSFDIEENHCPGTGLIGVELDKVIKEMNEKGFCWACKLRGRNEIVAEGQQEINDYNYEA
jgi:hypothetical protein